MPRHCCRSICIPVLIKRRINAGRASKPSAAKGRKSWFLRVPINTAKHVQLLGYTPADVVCGIVARGAHPLSGPALSEAALDRIADQQRHDRCTLICGQLRMVAGR